MVFSRFAREGFRRLPRAGMSRSSVHCIPCRHGKVAGRRQAGHSDKACCPRNGPILLELQQEVSQAGRPHKEVLKLRCELEAAGVLAGSVTGWKTGQGRRVAAAPRNPNIPSLIKELSLNQRYIPQLRNI